METYKNIYYKIYKWENILLAFRKARKGKSKKDYVKKFEENLIENLQQLQFELMTLTYKPKPLKTFILRDPKTRKISKADFRDRIIHHALCNIIEPIFQKSFIHDSCANQKRKGNIFAIKRFGKFKRKVTKNLVTKSFCLKADIRHYFFEVNHQILIRLLKRKIKDIKTIWLIKQIIYTTTTLNKGMPLGNLTSQLFANIYLHELDFFIKHKLKSKYYIRYVDDFIILHYSKIQLEEWKNRIKNFLITKLQLKLHPEKSKICLLSEGINFVGFRIYYYHKLLRTRNIKNMKRKKILYYNNPILFQKLFRIFQGWNAYAKWANCHNLTKSLYSTQQIPPDLFEFSHRH